MTIDELLALNGLTGSDEIPVWDAEESGEPTKKITAQNFANSVKSLASLLGTGDVVNNLTSDATDKPLSAAQGKALNDKIKNDWGNKKAWFTTQDNDCWMIRQYFGKTVVITFLSNSKVWAENDIVFTVPSDDLRPYSANINFIGTINRGQSVIALTLQSNGECVVWYGPSYTSATRIFGSVVFIAQ